MVVCRPSLSDCLSTCRESKVPKVVYAPVAGQNEPSKESKVPIAVRRALAEGMPARFDHARGVWVVGEIEMPETKKAEDLRVYQRRTREIFEPYSEHDLKAAERGMSKIDREQAEDSARDIRALERDVGKKSKRRGGEEDSGAPASSYHFSEVQGEGYARQHGYPSTPDTPLTLPHPA